jgi:hypothetical protein
MFFMPTLEQITGVMESKRYRLYKGRRPGERGLNLVGIRRKTASPDKFDDTIAIFYLIPGAADVMYFSITTDPSPHYLRRPVNSNGTAILKEGQYVDTHKVARHSPPSGNAHQAVCQRLGEVTVFRDNNKDGKLNFVNPESGMFGINIHKGPNNGNWESNNRIYSAGCQVFADADDFQVFLTRCNKEANDAGNVFTYTLLNESDFG